MSAFSPVANLSKVPVTIVTGFLGAGKTTLISHLIRNAGGRRLAVVVNEFGTLGVEMEAAGLYACAAAEGGEALAVLTVSDHLFDTSRDMSSEERETLYATSVRIAAGALLA